MLQPVAVDDYLYSESAGPRRILVTIPQPGPMITEFELEEVKTRSPGPQPGYSARERPRRRRRRRRPAFKLNHHESWVISHRDYARTPSQAGGPVSLAGPG